MLALQYYLQTHSLMELEENLGIKHNIHPTLPLITFNYSQMHSPKLNPCVMESRGIVLDKDYNLIAKSFNRFLNYAEDPDLPKKFDWSLFHTQEKVDGSLLQVFWYKTQWMVKTRGSWGEDSINDSQWTWRGLFEKLNHNSYEKLDKTLTYSFELCSLYNKVVRHYSNPTLYLLTATEVGKDYSRELSPGELREENKRLGYLVPMTYTLSSLDDINEFINRVKDQDHTYEGLVIRDRNDLRFKVKSDKYVALHHMGSDKKYLFNPKKFIPFILRGEEDEVVSYFEEVKPEIVKYKSLLDSEYQKLEELWSGVSHIQDQKEFALAIANCKLAPILFKARKENKPLPQCWLESENLLINRFVGK